jgi:hypothetical protein
MLNPTDYARVLAEDMVPRLEAGEVTGKESARLIALAVGEVAREALYAGGKADNVSAWVEDTQLRSNEIEVFIRARNL